MVMGIGLIQYSINTMSKTFKEDWEKYRKKGMLDHETLLLVYWVIPGKTEKINPSDSVQVSPMQRTCEFTYMVFGGSGVIN